MALFVALFAGFANIDDDSAREGQASESSRSGDDGRRSVLAMDLEPGDCIDEPRDPPADPDEVTAVLAVNVRPCHQAHDAEVVGAVHRPADDEADFPGDDAMFDHAGTPCLEAFEEWVGVRFEESALDLYFVIPNEEGWDFGDRIILCVAFPLDGLPLEGSVRDSGI